MDIEKLKALALAATPGEWKVERLQGGGHHNVGIRVRGPIVSGFAAALNTRWANEAQTAEQEANAAYIAAACPATVLELIVERDELRAEVERLRTELAAGAARQGGNTTKEGGLFSDPKYAQGLADSRFAVGLSGAAPAAGTEKDAERYRWLREKSVGQWEHPIVVEQMRAMDRMQYIGPLSFGALDAAIDAAIEARAKAAPTAPPAPAVERRRDLAHAKLPLDAEVALEHAAIELGKAGKRQAHAHVVQVLAAHLQPDDTEGGTPD